MSPSITPSGGGGGGSQPNVGQVCQLTGGDPQSIPNANTNWDALDLSTAGITNPQDWAVVSGAGVTVTFAVPTLVSIQTWVTWDTAEGGAVRGLNIAPSGSGIRWHRLNDAPTMLTPAQYDALAAFEGSMGAQGIARVDVDHPINVGNYVYQDSGGALNCTLGFLFIAVIGQGAA